MDAEREEKNLSFGGAPSLREARVNYYDRSAGNGSIGVMDAWRGAHLPEGKVVSGTSNGPWNTSDAPGYRRVARKLHLNRWTNGAFLDGHAEAMLLAHRTKRDGSQDHTANYAYWLRIFGVEDAYRIAQEDTSLD
jgi:prepilin-type processing-associated H-X9-DG protein